MPCSLAAACHAQTPFPLFSTLTLPVQSIIPSASSLGQCQIFYTEFQALLFLLARFPFFPSFLLGRTIPGQLNPWTWCKCSLWCRRRAWPSWAPRLCSWAADWGTASWCSAGARRRGPRGAGTRRRPGLRPRYVIASGCFQFLLGSVIPTSGPRAVLSMCDQFNLRHKQREVWGLMRSPVPAGLCAFCPGLPHKHRAPELNDCSLPQGKP